MKLDPRKKYDSEEFSSAEARNPIRPRIPIFVDPGPFPEYTPYDREDDDGDGWPNGIDPYPQDPDLPPYGPLEPPPPRS